MHVHVHDWRWGARCLNLISVMSWNHSIMVHHVYSVNYLSSLGAFGGYINPRPYTSLLVMSGGGLALFYCPWWGTCMCFVVMSLVPMSQNHKHYDSPCLFKAGWCVRQVMRIPCRWQLTSLKQLVSRDCGVVWPHHDHVHMYKCTCMYMYIHVVHACTYVYVVIHIRSISSLWSGWGSM